MTKALVVVAHPDDETIWMGGKILREKKWDWTVLSLCRREDPDRKPKFFRVCRELGAHGFISDMEDDHPEEDLRSLDEVVQRIEPVAHDKRFDVMFTHNSNGEYGHKRHKETHRAVMQMIEGGLIECKELFVFDYVRKEGPFRCEPYPNAPIKLALTRREHERKKYLIGKVYGFLEDSFEFISCCDAEHFKKVI